MPFILRKYVLMIVSVIGMMASGFSQTLENLNKFILNPVTDHPIRYFIVSDPTYREILQPFIQWKTIQGFEIKGVFTDDPRVGNTEKSIRDYLQHNILSTKVIQPVYVLLVGDGAQIPPRVSGGHITDFYYGEFTGDLLPEAYVGRFSAHTPEELAPQLEKTIAYEKCNLPGLSFLNKGLFVAGDDDFRSDQCNAAVNYISELFLAEALENQSNSLIHPQPQGENYPEKIIKELNHGIGLITYNGHSNPWGWSSPSFSISDFDKLQENNAFTFMIINSCQTADFSQGCFADALMKCRSKGAVGYIGATTDTFWDEDYWWSVGNKNIIQAPGNSSCTLGAFDRLFHQHNEPFHSQAITAGQILAAGNLSVAFSGSGNSRLYWETYCLLGDPSLMPYLSAPKALGVIYPQSLNADQVTVECLTQPYAYLALSLNGKLLDARNADSTGKIVLQIPGEMRSGPLQLIGTAQNSIPFTGAIHFNDRFLTMDVYPNPFKTGFTLRFTLTAGDYLYFDICDLKGKLVKEVSNYRKFEPGFQTIEISSPELSPGIYLLRVHSSKGIDIVKLCKS